MDEPSLRLREALDKFIKHVDDLIEEEDPAGNGFHREYRVSFDTSDIGNWTMSMHVPRSLRPTAEFTIPALKFKRERVSKCSSFFKRGVSFIKFVEYLIVCRLVRFVYEEQFCTSYAPFCFFFLPGPIHTCRDINRPWRHCCFWLRYVPWLKLSMVVMRYLCKLMR